MMKKMITKNDLTIVDESVILETGFANYISDLRKKIKRAGYVYDKRLGRYRNLHTGRIVSNKTVLSHLEKANDAFYRRNIRQITNRFVSGNIDLAAWQEHVAKELRDAYRTNMIAGRGGVKNMTQVDWGRMGGRLKNEYRYLNTFAKEIEMGQLSEKQIKARIEQYARGTRKAYYDGLTAAMRDAEMLYERRYTDPGAQNCDDCLGYEAQGWQPIGSLPEPGLECQCGSNCRCDKEYAKQIE